MNVVPTSSGLPSAPRSMAHVGGETGARESAVADTRLWRVTAWILVGVAGMLGVIALRSGEHVLAGLPPCALRHAFHVGCATCGFARAAVHLAQGDFVVSWMLHPFAWVVAIEAALGWVAWGAGLWRRRFVIPGRWWACALAITVAGMAGLWLVRMVRGTIPI